MASKNASSAHSRPIIVEPPRKRDVMARMLRDAYAEQFNLPDDMMLCLSRIDAGKCKPTGG